MSTADTADYERGQWTQALTAQFEYGTSLTASPDYIQGYLAALDDVAEAMNLVTVIKKEYKS